MRKGLLRLYLVLAVPWAAAWGYVAYDANVWYHHHGAEFDRSFSMRDAKWRDEELARRDFALEMLPVMPIGLPILMGALVWVAAGFRRQ